MVDVTKQYKADLSLSEDASKAYDFRWPWLGRPYREARMLSR